MLKSPAARSVLVLLGALFVVVGVLLATDRPASGDNCKELVKGVGDLANKDKLQDCLRTGSNIGRAIGTITAVVGITIAGIGLVQPKGEAPPTPPPKEGRNPGLEANPCARMTLRAERVQQLDDVMKEREQKIVDEWKEYQEEAARLQNIWRDIKNLETRTYWCVVLGTAGNAVTWMASLAALLGSATITASASTAFWTKVALSNAGQAVGLTAASVPNLAIGANAAAWFPPVLQSALGSSIAGSLQPAEIAPGIKVTTDLFEPLQGTLKKNLKEALASVGNKYIEKARTFNELFAQWGVNAQRDLEQLRSDTQSEIDLWRSDAEECKQADPPPPLPPKQDRPVRVLNVVQLPLSFGGIWVAGDWLRWGKSDWDAWVPNPSQLF